MALKKRTLDGDTHWCHLANMAEQSVHSDDASCQITYITC